MLGFYRLGVPDISITLKRIHRISSSATDIHMYTPLPDYLMFSGKMAKGKKKKSGKLYSEHGKNQVVGVMPQRRRGFHADDKIDRETASLLYELEEFWLVI